MRKRLADDHKAERLQTPTAYLRWLTDLHPEINEASARTAVHRELKALR